MPQGGYGYGPQGGAPQGGYGYGAPQGGPGYGGYGPGYGQGMPYGPGPYDDYPEERDRGSKGGFNPMNMMTAPMKMFGGGNKNRD
jgi:hypothetical protein